MTSFTSMLLPVEMQVRAVDLPGPVTSGLPAERRTALAVICVAVVAALLAIALSA